MKRPLLRLLSLLAFIPLAARGTIVTTVEDEDDGLLGGGTGISLREAVKYSPIADTVTFAPALSGQTIRLTLGELPITQSLTIDGSALAARLTLSGDKTGDGKTADDARVIQISNNTTVVLNTLAIIGGSGTAGGGIRISGLSSGSTRVTIRNSAFIGNAASGSGGAIYCGGDLDIQNSSFTGNSANSGAGIFLAHRSINLENTIFSSNAASNQGGAIYARGTLSMRNCVVTGHTASSGGGIHIQRDTLPLIATLENSTISDNSVVGYGGGIYNFGGTLTLRNSTCSRNYAAPSGGGIYHHNGSLLIENSTLSGNRAKGDAGGVYAGFGSVSLRNSTVSGNTANSFAGGGINNRDDDLILTLDSSIVAGNVALNAPLYPDISGPFTGSSNITSGNPRLAPLGDYGGPTHTMPPLPGSPAIDAGGTTTLTTDQRGLPRLSTPDIGAAEYQGTADLLRFWKLDPDGDGSPYGAEQALGTDPSVADSASPRRLTGPTLDASGHAVLTFGIGTAAPGTRWILSRSTDLLHFSEIYRYDGGTTDTAAPGITHLRTATTVTITDGNPPPGGAFYRFEAVLDSH
ncbi:MAG: choice-of-anchor Q domain-containing protein [Verrucomicrobiota bacterium]